MAGKRVLFYSVDADMVYLLWRMQSIFSGLSTTGIIRNDLNGFQKDMANEVREKILTPPLFICNQESFNRLSINSIA
ncbi:MAG: hypothetical protein AUK34_00595 [Ignavibacteria bacterium CG2_30_36_16]|nr:MAG: hypothetical protein AUK34_00595 [Ignavibacteria bacterium CG2_30_36_16]PJA99311.1 MAG: hypothetical protein CO127_10835 [Ignavibacteria bacterium CG_4_9_14_3_um_filter_36_18]